MWRNGLDHSYYCVNSNGIILSEQILDIPRIEVVVKRYCAGTDKYAYYGMVDMDNFCYSKEEGMTDAKYKGGPYVRFDWRNPNHLLVFNNIMRNPVESPWYYLYEAKVGKEKFFNEFIRNEKYCKPLGDKCLPEHLAKREIDVEKTKRNVLRMFYAISYYLHKMNLEIQDVCFMVDRSGSIFWSEINQDCMRIKALGECYDKDLWRVGGSDAKQKILDKWGQFNPMLAKCLTDSTFISESCYRRYPYYNAIRDELMNISPDDEYRILYRSLLPISCRRVMVTCDIYNGKPTLVKSGKIMEYHSDSDINKAMDFISIFPDILTVDLNAAMDDDLNNRQIIKENATKYYTHCGGGLRTLDDVQDVLSASARRIVVSTNLSEDFLKQIPKDRLIVELSINQNNQIMTHGRKELCDMSLRDIAKYLHYLGVQVISVTFHMTEGHLSGINRNHVKQVYEILSEYKFDKIYIARGISTLDDMEFIWSLSESSETNIKIEQNYIKPIVNVPAIPQLGSAIWKGKLSIGEIYCAMVSATDTSEIPAIIQSNDGKVKGLIYLNRQAIINTCRDRLLWRYSRRHGRVMLKGESSGNVQKIIKIAVDCDSDSLLITVDTTHPFCHTGNTSCFSLQTSIKGNLVDLTSHIAKSSQSPNSYTDQMIKYPGLALMKTMEEFWEVVTSEHLGLKYQDTSSNILNQHKLRECCDFLAHFLMYLTSRNINIEDIFNELNARRWNPKLITPPTSSKSDIYVIGVTANKYSNKTDDFIYDILGIKIIRSRGRNMKISYEIIDQN
jgi:phosphoribosyl-AMP cyclohydrolase/phosphoribosylformimino-5-aminoimidazole carboxamide ribonucleotide (ProFAR) isomerase/phosphoribosyl-ATP pyrophosphohydrolase